MGFRRSGIFYLGGVSSLYANCPHALTDPQVATPNGGQVRQATATTGEVPRYPFLGLHQLKPRGLREQRYDSLNTIFSASLRYFEARYGRSSLKFRTLSRVKL